MLAKLIPKKMQYSRVKDSHELTSMACRRTGKYFRVVEHLLNGRQSMFKLINKDWSDKFYILRTILNQKPIKFERDLYDE